MKLIADLHIHSRFSRAVSDKMVLEEIARWASLKGINLVGTGDFTHPLWFREITSKLEEASEGLFRLRSSTSGDSPRKTPDVNAPLFILQQEISSIYSQGGRGRRIHNLIYSPSIQTVEKINKELIKRGCNLMSDGRPIIGLSSIELCELVFSIDEKCLIVPAHIWTPWFSLYGSKSGFDFVEDCFGKYAKYIYAIETGLSSDPAMNWRIKELEERSIISSSDAHSGPKLGREVTIFDIPAEDSSRMKFPSEVNLPLRCTPESPADGGFIQSSISKLNLSQESEDGGSGLAQTTDSSENLSSSDSSALGSVSYMDIYNAVKNANYKDKTKPRIAGTIEFYPEEGKYHYTGHRNCGVCFSPEETQKKGTTCPVCGKALTVGVMHRVDELAVRSQGKALNSRIDNNGVQWIFHPKNKKPPYTMLVPLFEIICEVLGGTIYTQNVKGEYQKLTSSLGDEFFILLKAKLADLERVSGKKMAEAVKRNRMGNIVVLPGFDGEFGKVKIFAEKEKKEKVDKQEQLGMF